MNQTRNLLCGRGILLLGGGSVQGTREGAERETLGLEVGWFVRSVLEQLIHRHLCVW